MRISKDQAERVFKSLIISGDSKLFARVKEEFYNMSQGGQGGPFKAGHTWTTVRKHYYPTWKNEDFNDVLERVSNIENSSC